MGRIKGYKNGGGRVKRPDAKANAKSRTVMIRHGGVGGDVFRHARIDKRSRAYKAYQAEAQALVGHIGENRLSAPLRRLIDQAARLMLLEHAAWAEVNAAQSLTTSKGIRPAVDAFLKVSRERRAILQMLGIERKEKVIPDLQEYLESNYGKTEHGEDTDNS